MSKFRAFYNNYLTHIENRVDEIVFQTSEQKLSELEEFHKIYPSVFIWILTNNIVVNSVTDIADEIAIAQQVNGGIMLFTLSEVTPELVEDLHKLNVKVSCLQMVHTFAGIDYMLNSGIDDFGITNPITFDMNNVRELCGFENMRHIWVCPDVSQHEAGNSEKGFYILPQHLSLFEEEYLIETFFIQNYSKNISTVLDIYAEGKWNPVIWPLIAGYKNETIEGNALLPTFAIRRATCKQSCFYRGHCETCKLTIKYPKIEE
jgi:hypothetical protein